jgi:hypothetical protein
MSFVPLLGRSRGEVEELQVPTEDPFLATDSKKCCTTRVLVQEISNEQRLRTARRSSGGWSHDPSPTWNMSDNLTRTPSWGSIPSAKNWSVRPARTGYAGADVQALQAVLGVRDLLAGCNQGRDRLHGHVKPRPYAIPMDVPRPGQPVPRCTPLPCWTIPPVHQDR